MIPKRRAPWPPPDTVGPVCELCGEEVPRDTQRTVIADKPTLACAQCVADLEDAAASEPPAAVRRF